MASTAAAPIAPVARALALEYPDARTELDHRSAFELLVATVLSAQTTDARVNALTPELFARFPDAAALAAADESQVAALLHPLGMGATRARRIIDLARSLVSDHDGEVPDDQDALEALSGVGRKTALVVRGVWFGADALAVDTHVTRLAARLGWSAARTPRGVERDVLALRDAARRETARRDAAGSVVPEGGTALSDTTGNGTGPRADDRDDADGRDPLDATVLSLRLILHGRRVCSARSPRCGQCTLAGLCPSAEAAS